MNELMVYAMWDAEAGVWVALRCVARLLGVCKEVERLSRDADLPVEVGR